MRMHPHGHRPDPRGGGRFGETDGRRRELYYRHHGGGRDSGGRGFEGHGPGGHGFEGRGRGGRGHGGRGPEHPGFEGRGEGKRFFMRGEFKFALLELLAGEPMHGYQLIKAMEEKTQGRYTPSAGSIYPNLQLLEEMQLVSSTEVDGKKLYRITEEGQKHLRERAQTAPERPEERWERRGRHRLDGEFGKRDVRGLVFAWPEAVGLLTQAAKEIQANPDSEQAARLRAIVEKLREDLKQALASSEASGGDEGEDSAPSDSEPANE